MEPILGVVTASVAAPPFAGLLGLFALVLTPAAWCARYASVRASRTLMWDVPRVAQVYTTVVGSLAGFASASLIFAARAGIDRPHPEFEAMMALLLVAFLTLAAAAMEFGNMPNAADEGESFRRVQRTTFLIANVTLTQGVCISWLALRSVTRFAGLDMLSDAFAGLMVLVVLVAALRIAQYLFDLTNACSVLCLVTPLSTMGAAVGYLLLLQPLAPGLIPGEHGPLVFAMISVLVALAGFGLHITTFALHTAGLLNDRVARWVDYVAVGHAHLATTSIGLVAIVVIRS
jgi:hypothetical protein